MGKINCLADKRGEIARVINYRKLGGTACYTGDSTLSTIQNNSKTKSKMNKNGTLDNWIFSVSQQERGKVEVAKWFPLTQN